MAGVNLNEESARILATNSELVGTQIRSCKDEAFLHPGLLHRRILETGQMKCDSPVFAVQRCLSSSTFFFFLNAPSCSWRRLASQTPCDCFSSGRNLNVTSMYPPSTNPSTLHNHPKMKIQTVVVMKSLSVVFCVRNMLFLCL